MSVAVTFTATVYDSNYMSQSEISEWVSEWVSEWSSGEYVYLSDGLSKRSSGRQPLIKEFPVSKYHKHQ